MRCLLALLLSCACVHADRPPNIIWIVADDLGASDLGCTGSTFYKTPHIDAMAKAGLRFTDAYAACPVCSPTRCALMTGKYPQRLGITDWLPGRPDRPDQKLSRPALVNQLPLEEITIAEALKAKGYSTGLIGKWHLGGQGFEPEKQGFDVNIGGAAYGTTLSYFAPFESKKGAMPGLGIAPAGEYLTDRLSAEAVKFVTDHQEKPFFLYLPHYAPHTPLKAKPDIVAKYPNKPQAGKQSNATYAAMLESLDASVGALRAKLVELGLDKTTYVVFTSDNGGLATLEGMPAAPTINTPYREGKGFLYEGGTRVPLIVVGPGVPAGKTSSVPVVSMDLNVTAQHWAGISDAPKNDGITLAGICNGEAAPERPAIYWHYPHYSNQSSKPGGAVRAGRLKLIEFYETDRAELFDLEADVRESRNLADTKPDDVKRLRAMLTEFRKSTGSKMMTPNPEYVPPRINAEGIIALPAKYAQVTGTTLRFEPLPHKNCLGFWTRAEDTARWDFRIDKPGTYAVEIAQGCGTGNGGSSVEVRVGTQAIPFTVEETGGFQMFKVRTVGELKFDKPGDHVLTLFPTKKLKAAVMDVQGVSLRKLP